MSVSIKVAVRCRPFTIDDKLGVTMTQCGDEEGEIDLLNSSYSTTRFAFTYAWWSAFGYDRHIQSNNAEADAMEMINQEKVYSSVGTKIKADLLTGNAVVLFAYGLSGSGKTFTVFGPDAVDEPEAWFKHSKPHSLWGIFPRLAYEVFSEKQDGWKITMKYFQNVVDTVRDLMSPVGKEMHYKNGMKKDADGFVDIDWCSSAVLDSWDDLRRAFKAANERKAIAPTQFNHQSTRGHCIMTLELEMPHPDMPGMKQKGRLYVCDLAGTEPAGDIVYARYEKKVFDTGDIEYKYVGPHQDMRKTKELQDQGKKINLSLSEMAQFFMKMAEAVQQGNLKPGLSIPGCNSYFLCKYLKDTMLQARTYLFCAIRPEVTYHKYSFSTLGFAKNASVVKLKPKTTTIQATPAERKLMVELEQMKALVAQLMSQQAEIEPPGAEETAQSAPSAGGDTHSRASQHPQDTEPEPVNEGGIKTEDAERDATGEIEEGKAQTSAGSKIALEAAEEHKEQQESIARNAEQVSRLQGLLEAKQKELKEVLSGGGGGKEGPTLEERQLEQQKEEYGRRGISLSHFEADTHLPHLINVDEDPFRHNRFVYLLKKPLMVFGPHGDVQPMSLSVQRKHCSVEVKRGENGVEGPVTLIGGRGEVFRNGKRVRKQDKVVLSLFDRVAIGSELLLFRWKQLETTETGSPPSAEMAVMEFKRALQARAGRRRSVELHAMEAQLKELQAEKAKAETEAKLAAAEKADKKPQDTPTTFPDPLDDGRIAKVIASAEEEVHTLLPQVKETEEFMQLLGREYLVFDVSLQRAQGESFEVTASVQVKNNRTGQACYVSSFEFLEYHSIFGDEVVQLRAALDNERSYSVPEEHDPSLLLLEGTHQLGVATLFTEPIVYMMATEDEEKFTTIKDVRAPYSEVGKLECVWHPLVINAEGNIVDPDLEENCELELPEIDSPKDLIGLPWVYRFEIKVGTGLPLTCASAYCQYDFLGETFTTETVQPDPSSSSPDFNYSFVHRVDKVTQEIVDGLMKPLNVCLYVGPYVEPEKPEDAISTSNLGVRARFESLTRPNTPSPSPPPAGALEMSVANLRCTSPTSGRIVIPSPRDSPRCESGVPSPTGVASPLASCNAGAGLELSGDVGKDSRAKMLAEVTTLREENSALKEELEEARAVIARLTESAGGGGGAHAPEGSSGGTRVATRTYQDAARDIREGSADTHALDGDGRGHTIRGNGENADRRTRDSRSRKQIDFDTARITDAAVEAGGMSGVAVQDGGEVRPAPTELEEELNPGI